MLSSSVNHPYSLQKNNRDRVQLILIDRMLQETSSPLPQPLILPKPNVIKPILCLDPWAFALQPRMKRLFSIQFKF